MSHLVRALLIGLLVVTVLALPAQAAPKYATYHINYLMLTPSKVYSTRDLGNYQVAQDGKKFLVVLFHVVNKGDVQQEVTYNDIKATLSSGQIIEESFDSFSPRLSGTVLDVGGVINAGLAFDVPAGMHSAALKWHPSGGFSDVQMPTYAWKVSF